MSRRLRLEIPGGVDHVTNRGVDHADIVRDDDDWCEWLGLTVSVVAGQSRLNCGQISPKSASPTSAKSAYIVSEDTERFTHECNHPITSANWHCESAWRLRREAVHCGDADSCARRVRVA